MLRTTQTDWPRLYESRTDSARDARLRAFFAEGTIDAETPLRDVPFVALDFETTGLNRERDEIISIGAVPFDLARIRPAESRYWLLKPKDDLTASSVPFHGITHSALDDAPDLEQVLGPLLESLAGKIVVVHFRYIEREFLDIAVRRRLGEGVRFPLVDTMELEAMLYRQGFKSQLKRLLGLPRTSIRLDDSRRRYGLPHYGQHHALTDAIATAELLQTQIAHRYSPYTPLSEICV